MPSKYYDYPLLKWGSLTEKNIPGLIVIRCSHCHQCYSPNNDHNYPPPNSPFCTWDYDIAWCVFCNLKHRPCPLAITPGTYFELFKNVDMIHKLFHNLLWFGICSDIFCKNWTWYIRYDECTRCPQHDVVSNS